MSDERDVELASDEAHEQLYELLADAALQQVGELAFQVGQPAGRPTIPPKH